MTAEDHEIAKEQELIRYKTAMLALKIRKLKGEDVEEEMAKEEKNHKTVIQRLYYKKTMDGYKAGHIDCVRRVRLHHQHDAAYRKTHQAVYTRNMQRWRARKRVLIELHGIDETIFQ
jgi:phage tail tube protein FII